MECLKHWSNESFDLSDERGDRLGFGVKEQNAAQVSEQENKRIVQGFFRVLAASVFLAKLSFEELDEFGFEEHLMQGDENFDDHEHDLAQCVDEPDAIFDFEFFSEHFGAMESDKIGELFVDDLELVSDKLFKHEDIFVFVDVVKSVDIRP